MTLCEKCIHGEICAERDCHDEDDERAMTYCADFKNKTDFVEVVRCKGCKKFMEYSDDYKFKVEGADGDCHIRLMHSTDNQLCAVKYDDFCSYGERK